MTSPQCIVERASIVDAADAFSLVEEYYDAVSVVARDDRAKLSAYLVNPECAVWLARDGAAAIGCILYHPLSEMGSAGEVKRLYVRPAFRGRGFAQLLLDSWRDIRMRSLKNDKDVGAVDE